MPVGNREDYLREKKKQEALSKKMKAYIKTHPKQYKAFLKERGLLKR